MSPNLRPSRLLTLAETKVTRVLTLVIVMSVSLTSLAQQSTAAQSTSRADTASANPGPLDTVTVPADTYIALVLTHPIQSRYIHRGDDIYAQITSAVTSGNEVVIPPGTLVQGKVDKLGHNGNRGELHLQSLSVIFRDGYVAPVAGPITMQSNEGYALKDPGQGRIAALAFGPLAGSGIGALIGHSVAPSQGPTLTASNPPGCTPGSFGCVTSSVTGPPDKGKDTVIGAGIGAGVGLAAGLFLAFSSHHFFLDLGAPVEMILQHPLTLEREQVANAIRDAERNPTPQQPVAPRPQTLPLPPNTDTGICWTPGTPGTPDTDIPGTPPIGDSPGTPSIHIPGIPPTPPTPHPCP